MQQHRVASRSLDKGANRGLVLLTGDQVAFPVPWNRTVLNLGWAVADHHHRIAEPLIPLTFFAVRLTFRSSSPKCLLDFPFQATSGLEVEGLVDRFVAHPHALVVGMIPAQTVRDLLW